MYKFWFISYIFIQIDKIIRFISIGIIYCIRPILGPMNICPYTIGCTQYALMQLEKEHWYVAFKNILKRLLDCHPFRKNIL